MNVSSSSSARVIRGAWSDVAAHAEAVAYGRCVGVPGNQLDWKD